MHQCQFFFLAEGSTFFIQAIYLAIVNTDFRSFSISFFFSLPSLLCPHFLTFLCTILIKALFQLHMKRFYNRTVQNSTFLTHCSVLSTEQNSRLKKVGQQCRQKHSIVGQDSRTVYKYIRTVHDSTARQDSKVDHYTLTS